MKTKLLVSILVVAMLLTAFMELNVKAANGPSNTYSFIRFYNQNDEVSIYNCMGQQNGELEGVTYDKDSNTLTLNNYTANYAISANMMGDDFKINLVGDNSIQALTVWGDGYGGSLTIIGDGTLTINGNKNEDVYAAICFAAEETAATLTVANTANINLYASEAVIISNYSTLNSVSKFISLRNGQDISANIKKENTEYQEYTNCFMLNDINEEEYTVYTKDGKKYGMREVNNQVQITNFQIAYDSFSESYFLDRSTSTNQDAPWELYTDYNTIEDATAAGYVATEEIIIVTKNIEFGGYSTYKDANNVKYAVKTIYNYIGNNEQPTIEHDIYDITECEITLADGRKYNCMALNTNINFDSLTESTVIDDKLFNYAVNLKELHIVANPNAEEPSGNGESETQQPASQAGETTQTGESTNQAGETAKPAEETAKQNPQTESKEVKIETADAKSAEDVSAKKEVSKLIDTLVKDGKVQGINEEVAKKIKEKIDNGEQLYVEVTTKEIKADEIKQDVEKVEKKITQDTKVVAYFDIGVLVKTASENLGNVTDLGDKISLTVDMPKDIPALAAGYTRTYKVIRVHDGVAEELETKVVGDKITFTSDKFSTYALTYTDTKTTSNPKTGDMIALYMGIFAFAAFGIVDTALIIRKK